MRSPGGDMDEGSMPRLLRRTPGPRTVAPHPEGAAVFLRVSRFQLVRLLSLLAIAPLRRTARIEVMIGWIRQQRAQGATGLSISLLGKQFLLVAGPAYSAHVLEPPPVTTGYVEGRLKRSSMAFLAPRALTISHGDAWRRRRAFNERALCSGRPHDLRAPILDAVREAFVTPVHSPEEIRDRMRRVMLRVVLGKGADPALAGDIDALMGVVGSPPRRWALGWRSRGRRARFYRALHVRREAAPATSLLGYAGTSEELDSVEAIEQVPHWMFPFTGSASDLLIRAIALAGSRPAVVERIAAECAGAGSLDDPDAIDRLAYLEACILEAGRLYPPVAVTFHTPMNGDTFAGSRIAAGTEVVHYFPFLHRGIEDPAAHRFDPDHPAPASNLFLSGARACPGRDLILFVLKAATATLLVEHRLGVHAPALAVDPVPLAFPERDVQFVAAAADR
jgi:cytochrome P450